MKNLFCNPRAAGLLSLDLNLKLLNFERHPGWGYLGLCWDSWEGLHLWPQSPPQAAGEKADIRGRMDPTGFRKAEAFQEKTWVVSPVSPPAQTRVVGPGEVRRLGWGWGRRQWQGQLGSVNNLAADLLSVYIRRSLPPARTVEEVLVVGPVRKQ